MSPAARPYRLSGISGVLFVVCSFVAAGMNRQPPSWDQEGAVLVAWFEQNGQWFRVGHLVAGFAFLLFWFPFFAGLCEKLRLGEGEPSIWSRVCWAGAIMCPAVGTGSGMFVVGAALAGARASPEVLVFAAAANFYGFVVSGAMGGVALVGAAVVILRSGVLARWLGWSALVIGLAAITSCAAVAGNSPTGVFAALNGFAWPAFFLWIVAASVALMRDRFTADGSSNPNRSRTTADAAGHAAAAP